MKQRVGGTIWDAPVASISPEQVVAPIPATMQVTLLVGAVDSVAPKELTQEYYQRLRQQGIAGKRLELLGLGHEILLTQTVRQEISQLLH